MRVDHCCQGSPEWLQLKCGKIGASRVDDVLKTLKRGGESETRRKFKLQIAAERMTEIVKSNYVSDVMQWGLDQEPIARTEYELKTGNDVRQVGWVYHPTIEDAGCSPDGLINPDGGLEIKAPESTTHIDYLLAGKVPAEYEAQVMWSLACTEREWWDFVSFDPRMPKKHQLLIVRMYRDEARIKAMNEAVNQFLAEVDEVIRQLTQEAVPA